MCKAFCLRKGLRIKWQSSVLILLLKWKVPRQIIILGQHITSLWQLPWFMNLQLWGKGIEYSYLTSTGAKHLISFGSSENPAYISQLIESRFSFTVMQRDFVLHGTNILLSFILHIHIKIYCYMTIRFKKVQMHAEKEW